MTIITKADAITAAMGLAEDVAEGRLSPAALEAQAVTELQALVGTVVGPGDPVWDLQVQITHGVLAAGGIERDLLAEWLAVARHRAGEPASVPEPVDLLTGPLPADSPASEPLSAETDALGDVEPEPVAGIVTPAPTPVPQPQRRAEGYDPLAGWDPGGTRR